MVQWGGSFCMVTSDHGFQCRSLHNFPSFWERYVKQHPIRTRTAKTSCFPRHSFNQMGSPAVEENTATVLLRSSRGSLRLHSVHQCHHNFRKAQLQVPPETSDSKPLNHKHPSADYSKPSSCWLQCIPYEAACLSLQRCGSREPEPSDHTL